MLYKNCLICKKLFQKPYTESLRSWYNRRKYCSKLCADKSPRSIETREKMRIRKINYVPWNSGIKLDEKHRKALRVKHKFPLDTTKMMGRRPWNKIGDGITPINERIRKSPEYKKWRKEVFERDEYTCVKCGARNRRGKKVILQADHIKPFAYFPKLRFELPNGRTLCKPCHRLTESYGINQWTQFSNKFAKNTNAA